MKAPSHAKRILGVVLFSLGILLGIAFTAVAVWGDLEASLFDTTSSVEATLRSLSCPILVTRGETGQVGARLKNTSPQPVDRAVRIRISERHVTVMREESAHVRIEPGETRRVSWPVDERDAAYGLLILARVSTLRQAPLPAQSAACGILTLAVPFVGGLFVVALWLTLSLAGMVGGGILWLAGGPRRVGRALGAWLAGAVLAGIIVSLLGLWLLGVLVLAFILILLLALFAQAMRAG